MHPGWFAPRFPPASRREISARRAGCGRPGGRCGRGWARGSGRGLGTGKVGAKISESGLGYSFPRSRTFSEFFSRLPGCLGAQAEGAERIVGSPNSPHRAGARWGASPSPTPRCGVRCGAGRVGFSGRGGRARPFRTERDREMPQRRAAGAGPAWPRPSWKLRAARSTAPLRPPRERRGTEPGLVPAAQRGAQFLARTCHRSRAGLAGSERRAESRAPLESFDSFQIAAASDVSLRPGVGSPGRRVLREPVGVGGLGSASRRSARPWRAPRCRLRASPREQNPGGKSPPALRTPPEGHLKLCAQSPSPWRGSARATRRCGRAGLPSTARLAGTSETFSSPGNKESRARGSRDS